MDILLRHFMMTMAMPLDRLTEIQTEVDHQDHMLHLMGVLVLLVLQVQ